MNEAQKSDTRPPAQRGEWAKPIRKLRWIGLRSMLRA
jgi:hypothetical protein